jgi:hypothetical protein
MRQREQPEAEEQDADHGEQEEEALAKQALQDAAVAHVERLFVLGPDLLLGHFGYLEKAVAQDRRHRHREQPRHGQRDQDHLGHRAQVLARGVGRQGQGHEHQHRGDGRDQQRHRQAAAGVGGGIDPALALEQPLADLLGDHDAVVDEEPQRDDEGRERDAVHRDAEIEHQGEGHDHGQRDVQPHDETRTHAQEAHDHDQHDRDGLEQVAAHRGHGALHVGGLVVADLELEADGQDALDRLELLRDAGADVENVLAFGHAHADQDGLLAVVVEGRGRGIHVAPAHGGDVLQVDHLARVGTRFSEIRVSRIAEIEKPSWARRAVENSTQIVSSWTP